MRPTQWAKNLFVLAPLVFAERLAALASLAAAGTTLVSFCMLASAVYLVNDLRDRAEDRLHPLKRQRPIAAGTLPPGVAWSAAAVLAAGGFALAASRGPAVAQIAGVYLALNVLYSVALKHVVILDVMSISLGFVLRVMAGAAAIAVAVSDWLLLCTSFLALFLAFSKRRHELALLAGSAAEQRRVLTHYSLPFLDQMINVVTASSVVCYALYAVSPETAEKFHTRLLILTLPMVLFGIFRYLYLLYQRTDLRNPTEAILRDAPFLINLALWGLAVVAIVYGT